MFTKLTWRYKVLFPKFQWTKTSLWSGPVCFTSLRNHLGFLLFLSTILSRWFAGGKLGKGEWEMVPREVINSTQICHTAKVLFCPSSGEVFILSWRKTHVHTHIHTSLNPHKWNPLFGEASYRKLTYAQELANLFCHIRIVPAASVTTHTKPNHLGFDSLPAQLSKF